MLLLLTIMLVLVGAGSAGAVCSSAEADAAFERGFVALRDGDYEVAEASLKACLDLDPECLRCRYELGWVHWSLQDWEQTVAIWEDVLEADPDHNQVLAWLDNARSRAKGGLDTSGLRVSLHTSSSPEDSPVTLELIARFQRYDRTPEHRMDIYDRDILSPKSANFHPSGEKVYVNSLEGYETVVYDPNTLTKVATISHRFDSDHRDLFQGMETIFDYPFLAKPKGSVNTFGGKPVEATFSHGGKWLYVPYYRRSYDRWGVSPSAMAVIDTETDTIVRVLPTGPIPKYVAASPDNRWLAVTHWGDNTIAMLDISSGDPGQFAYVRHLTVEKQLPQAPQKGKNRDSACGFCLRGTVFTPDSNIVLIARMGGSGIAGFRTSDGAYLGSVFGMKPTPRHLALSPDGQTLYFSSNISGYVSGIDLDAFIREFQGADGRRVRMDGWREVYVGPSCRTIDVSPDGRYLFAALNRKAEVAVIDAATMEVVARTRSDSYTVGLGLSPDGQQVWTTSQGRDRRGGNSVCVYRVRYASASTGDAPMGEALE